MLFYCMSTIPTSTAGPPEVVTLADHEALARQHLDDNSWAYFSGGAADEITLRSNRSAWDQLLLHPRVLRPLAGGHTRTPLLGRTLAHPILFASRPAPPTPTGNWPQPTRLQPWAPAWCSAHRPAHRWRPLPMPSAMMQGAACAFQLYLQHDRGFTRELVQRAETAGYVALVLTVDAPSSGARDRERRAGFCLPPGISAVNLSSLPPPPPVYLSPGQSALFDGLLHHAPTWDDVAWLRLQRSRACPCCSKACCTRRMPARPCRWVRQA